MYIFMIYIKDNYIDDIDYYLLPTYWLLVNYKILYFHKLQIFSYIKTHIGILGIGVLNLTLRFVLYTYYYYYYTLMCVCFIYFVYFKHQTSRFLSTGWWFLVEYLI